MASQDQYVSVSAEIIHRTDKAICVDDHSGAVGSWIALSLIHGADEARLRPRSIGEKQTFRLMAWKAAELDL